MKSKIITLLLCALLACSCSGKKNKSTYEIGIDPTWYPLQVPAQEKNLLAFSIELLVEIAKKERLPLAISTVNWDNLVQGLGEKKYAAILGSLPLYNFNVKKYSFSEIYLKTGPVLVIPENSSIKGVMDLKGIEVGVVHGSSAAVLLQTAPGVILRNYDTVPATLADLFDQQIEAAAVPAIIAQDYVRNFYSGNLKIIGPPLNDEGLRLITLHQTHPDLIRRFNKGLTALKKNGEYDNLLKKWGLSENSKNVAGLEEEIQAFLEKVL
jgi:polar amino acid transport system substrate-binding protein